MSYWDSLLKIYSNYQATTNANDAAADSTGITNQYLDQALDSAQTGYQNAIGTLTQSKANDRALMKDSAAGVAQQRKAIAQQNTLTPAQTQALEEAQTNTVGAMNSSGLRGSGAATAAAVKDVQGTLRNNYLDSNRDRADSAASALSNQYFNAGSDINNQNARIANTQTALGNTTAGYQTQIGQNQADLVQNQAQNTGDSTSSSLGTVSSAISDVSSLLKSDKKKNSSYT